jgi:hypothetical protein
MLPMCGAVAFVLVFVEVASCFLRSFFPAFVSGVVPVRRLANWLP